MMGVMAESARDRMVRSAVILLAKGGYQATSFGEVIAHSGAPRGSIYHHFPNGKDQLIAAAIEVAGADAIRILDGLEGATRVEVVDGFLSLWRSLLQKTDFGVGCSVLAVTVSAGDADLLSGAAGVFRAWTNRLARLLADAGMADAESFATLLVAASEGAVVMARAQRDLAPLDAVHARLRASVVE